MTLYEKANALSLYKFHEAMLNVQAAISAEIETLHTADGIRVGWRLAKVMAMLKVPMLNNGFRVRWEIGSKQYPGPKDEGIHEITGICILHHAGGHSESASFQVELDAFSDDLQPAQQYVAAVTLIKRITLEAVFGISTAETDDELNTATYQTYQTPYSEPVEPVSDPIPVTEIGEVKTYWAENHKPKDLPDDQRLTAFYDWVSTILEERITDDNQWTEQRVSKIKELCDIPMATL